LDKKRAAPPDPPRSLTLKLEGVNPHLFEPVTQPAIIGAKHRIVIEFDPVAGQASMTTEPEGALAPCQLLSIVLGLCQNMLMVAMANEANAAAALSPPPPGARPNGAVLPGPRRG